MALRLFDVSSMKNLPQIRANLLIPEVASLAEKMGSIVVLQSKGSIGTLRRAAMNAGIPAVTLEAGAPNNLQKEAVEEGPVSNKSSEIIAPFEGRVIGMALNQIMYPGFAAYHIGLKSSIVEAAQPQDLIPDEAVQSTQSLNEEEQSIEPNLPIPNEPNTKVKPSEIEAEKQLLEEMELPTIEN